MVNMASSSKAAAGAIDEIVVSLSFSSGLAFSRTLRVNPTTTGCGTGVQDQPDIAFDSQHRWMPGVDMPVFYVAFRNAAAPVSPTFGVCVRGGAVDVATQTVHWFGTGAHDTGVTAWPDSIGGVRVQAYNGQVTIMYADRDWLGRNPAGATCTGSAGVGWSTRESDDGGGTWGVGDTFVATAVTPCLAGVVQRGMRDFSFVQDSAGVQWAAAPTAGATGYVIYERDRVTGGPSAPWVARTTLTSVGVGFFPTLSFDGAGRLAFLSGGTFGTASSVGYTVSANAAPAAGGDWTLPLLVGPGIVPAIGGAGGDGDYVALAGQPAGATSTGGPTFLAAWTDAANPAPTATGTPWVDTLALTVLP